MAAFLLSDPRLESWLVEQAEQVAELTEKTKAAKLRKLEEQIGSAKQELREAAKAEAIAAVEAQYAGEAA